MFFPFCRLPEFLVSWRSSRSRCPSISASVSLLRRRMPSADVVSGIFWMNWREPRIIYCFERKSFFASFVSFPRSKLQNKEVAGPQRSNSGYKREDASTGSRGDVFVVRKSKPVENLWKNGLFWTRYSFVTHSIDRQVGLQYKIRKGRKKIWGRFSNPWNSNGIEWNLLILLTWSRILMYLPNTVGKRHKKAFKFIFGDRNLRLRDSAFVRCAPQQVVTEMT